jgi:hypothetical protein
LDVVGANVEMRAYIEYLVDRYITWRQRAIDGGIDRRPFHPSMIHRDIKRQFGARTYLVPQSRFQAPAAYFQRRIDDTITGRMSPHRNYHSFEKHLDLLHGKPQPDSGERDGVKPFSPADAALHIMNSGLRSARNKAMQISCVNNLKQIGVASRTWALDHGDALPTDFASMAKELGTEKITCCPAGKGVAYEILSPGVMLSRPSVVYARCLVHDNVLLADGSVHRLGNRRLARKKGEWMIE